jgi:ubiquinol-cytochrome c reductase iron-sulfur subunit
MDDHHRAPPTRRDFLSVCTASFAAVGGTLAAWPLFAQANPNAATPSPSILIDLTPIRPGQAITVSWRAQPVIIRHRTPIEVDLARSVPLNELIDPHARNAALPANAPASDANRTHAGKPEWLVVVGVCTHLACRLETNDAFARESNDGWFCRCHAARFDLAGRVRSGPAPTNLSVPPYRFVARNRMEIGRT